VLIKGRISGREIFESKPTNEYGHHSRLLVCSI
jgi:hypothetical protein